MLSRDVVNALLTVLQGQWKAVDGMEDAAQQVCKRDCRKGRLVSTEGEERLKPG